MYIANKHTHTYIHVYVYIHVHGELHRRTLILLHNIIQRMYVHVILIDGKKSKQYLYTYVYVYLVIYSTCTCMYLYVDTLNSEGNGENILVRLVVYGHTGIEPSVGQVHIGQSQGRVVCGTITFSYSHWLRECVPGSCVP